MEEIHLILWVRMHTVTEREHKAERIDLKALVSADRLLEPHASRGVLRAERRDG